MSRQLSDLITKFTGPAAEAGDRSRYQVNGRVEGYVQLSQSDAEAIVRDLAADLGILYARCPGCGDRADAVHMAVCGVVVRDRLRMNGWLAGALHVVSLVKTQVGRRGDVDVEKLVEAVEAMHASHVAGVRE